MARGSADYADRNGLGAVSRRNRLFWPCSASTACDSAIVTECAGNGVLVCEAAS
jgi:hypothetical protein